MLRLNPLVRSEYERGTFPLPFTFYSNLNIRDPTIHPAASLKRRLPRSNGENTVRFTRKQHTPHRAGLAFASGSATTATIVYALPTGSHVVSISDVYGGTNRFLSRVASVAVTMIDMQQVDTVLAAIRPETRLVWIESPTNPTLRITDIAAVSHAVHAARPDIWVVVDNTFLTPFNQQPLLLGADIVVHSVTKYLNGHCDVVMGVAVTNDTAIYERLRFLQNAIGAVPSPFDCWLANRGLKTLAVRMRAHETNAAAIAVRLETHEKIAKVHYPGLPSHPQHNVARKQQTGFGGMISFALKPPFGGEAATKLTQSTRLFTLAESLGGVESLIEVPAVMTHASVPPEQRAQLGITDGFIRLSCGIEDSADLIQDLLQALDKI